MLEKRSVIDPDFTPIDQREPIIQGVKSASEKKLENHITKDFTDRILNKLVKNNSDKK